MEGQSPKEGSRRSRLRCTERWLWGGISSIFRHEGGPRRVGCNDHCRRKFVKALDQGDSRAQNVIDLYLLLYAIERRAREAKLGVAAVLALRQSESVPIGEKLESEVARLGPLVGRKSPLGNALTSSDRQRPTLRFFLEDGFLHISNTCVERQIRTVAICRKAVSSSARSKPASASAFRSRSCSIACLLVRIRTTIWPSSSARSPATGPLDHRAY
ncbi:MAG: transposase [Myxococcales bacterium]|nr:transposase [Myxococcales bacterium]